MKMKSRYKIIILFLSVAAIILIVLSYLSWLGCDSQAARLIQILSALAIAITVVVALSSADIPKQQVKAEVIPSIIRDIKNWKIEHKKQDMTNGLKDFFTNCLDPVVSYKLQFKITNISVHWINPVVTFWLPIEKQHPREGNKGDKKWSSLGYHSNTYNTQVDLKTLEMVDGIIISNSNLPYWKKNKHITIWIRMVLENSGMNPFDVEVSIDCENANGFTQQVEIDPKKLINGVSGGKMMDMDGQIQSEEEEN